MKNEIIIEGKIFISARQAAEITKYATDYIGQLSRAGKINARMIGRTWFVDQQSLLNYKNHILMYIKNAKHVWHPAFILRELAMLGYIIIFETSTLKVIPELFRQLPSIWKKRKFANQ